MLVQIFNGDIKTKLVLKKPATIEVIEYIRGDKSKAL
jgi:hypothetical protein